MISIELARTASVYLFDFRREWNECIKPILSEHQVKESIQTGINEFVSYVRETRGEEVAGRVKEYLCNEKQSIAAIGSTHMDYLAGKVSKPILPECNTLEAYQPISRCFYLVRFCLAVGMMLSPHRKWEILRNHRHAVALGVIDEDCRNADIMVMDILREPSCEISMEQQARSSILQAHPGVSDDEWDVIQTKAGLDAVP